jgi:periplasmic protein TonB
MTAASLGRDPGLFTILSNERDEFSPRRDTFLFSLLGQAAVLALIIYLTSFVIRDAPALVREVKLGDLPLIFAGHNGGGGGTFDQLPASRGTPPRATLDTQVVPPTVVVPKEMPKLAVEQTVVVAPDVKFPEAGQIGDPSSQFSRWLSNGPGGPGGVGDGCCDGVGSSIGPHVGNGPPGIFPAGKSGVSVPEVLFNPEPSFSEEARKTKHQGIVLLLVVVGKDGHTYDIRVAQSLGMGLDEKAIEAVSHWRFKPAAMNGQPVATRIAIQVDFHLY